MDFKKNLYYIEEKMLQKYLYNQEQENQNTYLKIIEIKKLNDYTVEGYDEAT